MTEVVRVFIAVELPPQIQNNLALLAKSLGNKGGRVKWVPSENIHITVMFLGNIHVSGLEKIKNAIKAVAGDYGRCQISIKGIGVFPDKKRPRVVWGKVETGKEQLKDIYFNLRESLEYLNLSKEKQVYVPHATIGRIKHLKDTGQFNEAVSLLEGNIFGEFSLKDISLIQSILRPQGAVYQRLYNKKIGF